MSSYFGKRKDNIKIMLVFRLKNSRHYKLAFIFKEEKRRNYLISNENRINKKIIEKINYYKFIKHIFYKCLPIY